MFIPDHNRGAKRAREARSAFGLDPTAPLTCILTTVEEQASVPVVVSGSMPEDVDGVCQPSNGSYLLLLNASKAAVRLRFTLAHELGHVRCSHTGALPPETPATQNDQHGDSNERQANAFASEFLMPKAALENATVEQPLLHGIIKLAAYFGVSAAAMTYRLTQLDRITWDEAQPIRKTIGEQKHLPVYDELRPPRVEDKLSTLEHNKAELPYVSPKLSATHLGAALRNEAPVSPKLQAAMSRLLGWT